MATKNYDGDIFSEIVANGFGVHGLMYNTSFGKNGEILTEANHGTLVRHYEQWQRGIKTSTNPISTIYAWVEALNHRSRMD